MRDMYQAILMHANIDKRAEVGDIGHDTVQPHAGFKVGYFLDACLEFHAFEFRPGIASGLFQFLQNIGNRRQTKVFIGIVGRIQVA